jgi:NAD(P)-dependent dehydrogenase (short-subunit alcohol dehydrogenase family)
MKLQDKVCIVTGATSGMGKAIAQGLSSEGARLVLSGRNKESGQALENSLDHAVFVPGDVTEPSYNKKLVDTALETYGQLDILSLNAGVLGLGNVMELPIVTWQNAINTNLSALFYLCKYALPILQQQPQGNILINASIAAFKSFPNHPAYCASKAGAVALMKQMAVDCAPNIRVNAICPGPVDTPLLWESTKAFEHPETAVEHAKRTTLLKRLGTPQDITKLVLFLVSDDSSWITGTTVTIDGGIINT